MALDGKSLYDEAAPKRPARLAINRDLPTRAHDLGTKLSEPLDEALAGHPSAPDPEAE